TTSLPSLGSWFLVMVVAVLILITVVIKTANSLSCHQCAGAAYLPPKVAEALTAANMSATVPVSGNCKAKTGTDVCTDKFCVKKTVTYSVSVKGITFTWDTYTKGCASVREDTREVPTNTCYDISTADKGTYKQSVRHCYCQKDFCNAATSPVATAIYLALTIFFSK
ncbi:hypothetical protein V3C99_011511, partial [Haemonchus contortus]|uniref:Protein quiver n=1 Tax=Haemonchus contortus TaxID=6289 RepID=A0A7I4Y783_HAECO